MAASLVHVVDVSDIRFNDVLADVIFMLTLLMMNLVYGGVPADDLI